MVMHDRSLRVIDCCNSRYGKFWPSVYLVFLLTRLPRDPETFFAGCGVDGRNPGDGTFLEFSCMGRGRGSSAIA